jgi:hypothetical protein
MELTGLNEHVNKSNYCLMSDSWRLEPFTRWRYKPAGRGFDYRLGILRFSFVLILPVALWSSISKTTEYQWYLLGGKDGRCACLTTLPHSCAECQKVWQLQTSGALRAYLGLCRNSSTFLHYDQHRKDRIASALYSMRCRVRFHIHRLPTFSDEFHVYLVPSVT